MSKVSIQIESTDTLGNKKQKQLTDINPEATSQQIKSFAQNLILLTNQTYNATNRIEKINVDTESGKATPTLTLDPTTLPASSINSGSGVEISYSGDAELKDFFVTFSIPETNILAGVVTFNNVPNLWLKKGVSDIAVKPCTLTLHTPETNNYKAASVTFTVTA